MKPDTIRQYLNTDRLYAAYALGDLEADLFPQCRWWLAERGTEWGLVLHFGGLDPHAAICLGDPAAVGMLLVEAPLPDQVHLICRPEHLDYARETWLLPAPNYVARMVLAPERFRAALADRVVRLSMEHLDSLRALYAVDPAAADAFAPYQLAGGVFFGVEADNQLVSAAGTHLVALAEGIGAIGNIFTHPAHRRHGYGAACTSAVCTELLVQDLTVVLNVGVQNTPAVRLYERLGFQEYCYYYETIGTKIIKE